MSAADDIVESHGLSVSDCGGVWHNRLWSALSVETWLRSHLSSPELSHPGDCYRDLKSKQGHCRRLAMEIAWTIGQVEEALDGLQVGHAATSDDFVVWRDESGLIFVPLTRGPRVARTFEHLARSVATYKQQIKDLREASPKK